MIRITDDISIDESELTEEFIRSGGPGGQHVNKVSTAVQLRFDIRGSTLPLYVKERLKRLGGSKVSNEGVLVISSRGTRQRERNRIEALDKLVALIKEAAERTKRRVKTRVSKAAKGRRLDAKKVRGSTKRLRGRVTKDD
jgi:ribosome-associated protein